MPSPGYRVSGKEVEVRDSGSRHHQLCGRCNLQLIQKHVAPCHGPPARVLSPFFFPQSQSLLLPKLRGKKKHPKNTWSSLIHSIRTVWSSLFTPEALGTLPHFRTAWSSTSVAAAPRFKSQHPSSFAAPFPTPPTISYTCQHPIFFQLYWAVTVSPGRCGPMAKSQSSPTSLSSSVTRGSCFPVPFWVEFAPIPLAQSRATAI